MRFIEPPHSFIGATVINYLYFGEVVAIMVVVVVAEKLKIFFSVVFNVYDFVELGT